MKCWSCQAENDLSTAQTCVRCGAPLAGPGGLFPKSVVLGVAGACLVLQALGVLWIVGLRGCR